jgi:hypothetical protein
MYVQWQGMSLVETRREDKATRNAGDSVANCQERTAAVYDVGLQAVLEIQRLEEAFNSTETSCGCKG